MPSMMLTTFSSLVNGENAFQFDRSENSFNSE